MCTVLMGHFRIAQSNYFALVSEKLDAKKKTDEA